MTFFILILLVHFEINPSLAQTSSNGPQMNAPTAVKLSESTVVRSAQDKADVSPKAGREVEAAAEKKLPLLEYKIFGELYPGFNKVSEPPPTTDENAVNELKKIGLKINVTHGIVNDPVFTREMLSKYDGFIMVSHKMHLMSDDFVMVSGLDVDFKGTRKGQNCNNEVQVVTKESSKITSLRDLKDKDVVMEALPMTLNFLLRSPVKFKKIHIARTPEQALQELVSGKVQALIERANFYDSGTTFSYSLGKTHKNKSVDKPGYLVVGTSKSKVQIPCYGLVVKKTSNLDIGKRLLMLANNQKLIAPSIFFKLGRFERIRGIPYEDWTLMKKIRNQQVIIDYNNGKLPFVFKKLP